MVITDSLFEEQINKFTPFENNLECAVAVSGGADSMCLAIFLQRWALANNAKVIALIVDHGLRVESSKEATTVSERLALLGIKSKILKLNLEKKSSSIQQRAREARYEALFLYCKENNILHLFVGHHFNDQQETISMRLARADGLVGFAGMSSEVYGNNVRILRPMLSFTKNDIYETLKSKFTSVKWVEDPSNQNTTFERVRVRNALSSKDGNSININNLQNIRKKFEKELLSAISCVELSVDNLGVVRIDKNSFLAIEDEKIKVYVLSRILSALSCKMYPAPYKACLAVINEITKAKKVTLYGNLIYVLGSYIVIHREFRNMPNELLLSGECDGIKKEILWDNRFKLEFSGTILQQKEYTLKALGKDGYRQLKKTDKLDVFGYEKSVDKTFFYTLPCIFGKNNMVILSNQYYINSIEVILNKCALVKHFFN